MGAVNSSTRNPDPDSPDNSTSPPTTSLVPSPAEAAEAKEEECGFCLFMKGGPCKDAFIAWQDCVEEKDEKIDLVAKCSEVTRVLKECLEANPGYYGPILKAEKRAEEQVSKDLRVEDEQQKKVEIVVKEAVPSSSQ
ncbi:hypothetical protein LINPERPRIM_LOCUS29079 [Linum perenne]